MKGRDPFDLWYSTHAIAARFVTGLDAAVAERTVRREIERQPSLKAVAVRKFGQVFLPWRVLEAWLSECEPAKAMPGAQKAAEFIVLEPIAARTEGELARKLAGVQTLGTEVAHG